MGMLVLTRKPDEGVKIGDDVEVRVVSVKGRNVRLGIVAPKDKQVLRDELDPKKPREPKTDKPEAA